MENQFFDLNELGNERVNLEGILEPGLIDFSKESFKQLEDIVWTGFIERVGSDIHIQGHMKTSLGLTCFRCLDLVAKNVDRSFDLFFTKRDSFTESKDEDIELEEADTKLSFMSGMELPFPPVLREQTLLAIPMKLLCSTNCMGLCPSCGVNRNSGSCDCPRSPKNLAFEGLLELKKQLEEESI